MVDLGRARLTACHVAGGASGILAWADSFDLLDFLFCFAPAMHSADNFPFL
jgi:hypothetical protein